MPIFNSLGSNYSFNFVLKSLIRTVFFSSNSVSVLEATLQKSYPGKYVFTWKGRNALTLAIEGLGLQGKEVLTQAFTCWAVEEAIIAAKALPRFVDTGKDSLNLNIETLEKALKLNPKAKALIVQHTLGYPADIEAIASWCKKNKLFLIEDLAHSAFCQLEDGRLLGSFGDAIAFSFGRDKVIDSISGGAVCFKKDVELSALKQQPDYLTQLKTLLYPLITYKIRFFYNLGLGKVIHTVAKKVGLMSSPIESAPELYVLPNSFAALAVSQVNEINTSLAHRRRITAVYNEAINNKFKLKDIGSTNLRYAILVKDRDKVINKLRDHQFYLSDTWYRQPVEMGSLKRSSSYIEGSCPNADYLSQHILNLPTHRYVTPEIATSIAQLINQSE